MMIVFHMVFHEGSEEELGFIFIGQSNQSYVTITIIEHMIDMIVDNWSIDWYIDWSDLFNKWVLLVKILQNKITWLIIMDAWVVICIAQQYRKKGYR